MGSHAGARRQRRLALIAVPAVAIAGVGLLATLRFTADTGPASGPDRVAVPSPEQVAHPGAPGVAERPTGAGSDDPMAREPGTTARHVDRYWAGVLRVLDRRRSRAFATAQPRVLDGVYLEGSPARAVDAATIRSYARRGLRIADLRVRFLSLRASTAGPGDVRLSVIDRIVRAVAVDAKHRHRPLPRDRPTAHELIVERTPDGWRIASIV